MEKLQSHGSASLASTPKGDKILMSETNLTDYPAMFLKNDGQGGMTAVFPRLPLEFGEDGDHDLKILKEANCMASYRRQAQLSMAFPNYTIMTAAYRKHSILSPR